MADFGALDPNERTAPVDHGPIATTEADKPWFGQVWFTDLLDMALPSLAIMAGALLLWQLMRARRKPKDRRGSDQSTPPSTP